VTVVRRKGGELREHPDVVRYLRGPVRMLLQSVVAEELALGANRSARDVGLGGFLGHARANPVQDWNLEVELAQAAGQREQNRPRETSVCHIRGCDRSLQRKRREARRRRATTLPSAFDHKTADGSRPPTCSDARSYVIDNRLHRSCCRSTRMLPSHHVRIRCTSSVFGGYGRGLFVACSPRPRFGDQWNGSSPCKIILSRAREGPTSGASGRNPRRRRDASGRRSDLVDSGVPRAPVLLADLHHHVPSFRFGHQ